MRALAFLLPMLLAACGKSSLTPETVINAPTGLGIKGYDPVAYFSENKAISGDAIFQASHKGVTYHFATAENLQAFRAKPEEFLPQYGGYCAYAMSNGNIVDINPKNWSVVDSKLYLNANIFAETLFSLNKKGHIKRADQQWQQKRAAVQINTAVP